MKRIIIFADGTWNSPGNKDNNHTAPTNVYRSFVQTIKDKCQNKDEQLVYYQEGVGTGNPLDRIKGGALGFGIDENIKTLYRFIVENYSIGTEIFLFGFSRGAYTVRSLAGLIRNCGILKNYNYQKVERAYFIYNSRDDKYHPNSDECIEFQKNFSHPLNRTSIKFIGVWDTVGALGIPFKFFNFSRNKYRFHDVKLSFLIQNAYHAVSIDENRAFFRPALWQKQDNNDQILEQCWFSGVHADVGGGYYKEDLYKIPLCYLVKKAKNLGLQSYYNYNLPTLKKNALHNPNESWLGWYRIIPKYYRNIDRTNSMSSIRKALFELILTKDDSLNENLLTEEYLHQSVIDKYKSNKDLPINLIPAFEKMKKEKRIIPY